MKLPDNYVELHESFTKSLYPVLICDVNEGTWDQIMTAWQDMIKALDEANPT